ncbi:MAG: hypothetical protein NT031_07145 [Planctomycetota bacterium]|nr:hypothetical protein [Planctomycetota bacterium]
MVFFDQVRRGLFTLVVSGVVQEELLAAPLRVRLKAGIVTPQSMDDALHVAYASTSACSAIVSWNFRHIVHFQKVPMYNAVNAACGYHAIEICSPPEVIVYEDED